jgi:hypothetical protein
MSVFAVIAAALLRAASPAASAAQDAAQRREPVSTGDSARLVGASRVAIEHFLDAWRNAWLASEMDYTGRSASLVVHPGRGYIRDPKASRPEMIDDEEDPLRLYNDALNADRLRALHCHLPDEINRTQFSKRWELSSLRVVPIRSRSTARSMCATWVLGPRPGLAAASRVVDSALTSPRRSAMRQHRALLLDALDRAAAILPGDDFLTGQRVRFLLDQGEVARAREVAAACAAAQSTCLLLRGMLEVERGDIPRADSLFRVVDAMLGADARCNWNRIVALLPPVQRARYEAASCAEQEAINRTFWWLSDPLFAQPGNERWAVHMSRKTWLLLHRAFERDERYNWQAVLGGDAVDEMIVRYGPPDFSAWGYDENDQGHDGYLLVHDSRPSPPYTTAEYTVGRVHSAPEWSAVESPFTAPAGAWTLATPRDSALTAWWPSEHFARSRQMMSFDEGQSASFRRQANVVFATAVHAAMPEIGATLGRRSAVLFLSPGPGDLRAVDRQTPREDGTFVLSAIVEPGPVLVGVESPSPSTGGLDVRTRFGTGLPATLAAIPAGGFAISEPLLLRGTVDPATVGGVDDAIANMRASLTLQGERKLGVYWESYGFRAGDSVDVTVRVARTEQAGALQRVGMALGVADNPNSSVEVRWSEPQLGRTATTLAGPVPVQLRTLQLDLSGLPPGGYVLSVSVAKRGRPAVSSERRFTLR